MKLGIIFFFCACWIQSSPLYAQEPRHTEAVRQTLMEAFPSMVDVHLETTFHYQNLEGEQLTFVQRFTFYLPDEVIGMEGFTEEHLLRRVKRMVTDWNKDLDCITVTISNYPTKFYSIKEELRLITVEFSCG